MAKKNSTTEPNTEAIDRLYAAVSKYVKSRGGSVVVIGGVEVQQWPLDPQYTYRIAVRCTGKAPTYSQPQTPKIKPLTERKRKAGA